MPSWYEDRVAAVALLQSPVYAVQSTKGDITVFEDDYMEALAARSEAQPLFENPAYDRIMWDIDGPRIEWNVA